MLSKYKNEKKYWEWKCGAWFSRVSLFEATNAEAKQVSILDLNQIKWRHVFQDAWHKII